MAESETTLDYRVCWAAGTNISFRGDGEWQEANPGESAEEIEDGLVKGTASGEGLELALLESGFEWWVETRPHE